MGWLSDSTKTISESLGVRKFIFWTIIGGLMGLAIPPVNWVLQHFGKPPIGVKVIWYWIIFGYVVMGFLLWTLLEYATKLRKEALPALSIDFRDSSPYVIVEPFNSLNPKFRIIRIKVTNTGAHDMPSCLVKLEDMRSNGVTSNAFIPVGLITQHQGLQKRPGGTFALRAKEHKYVIVAVLQEEKDGAKIALGYETNEYPNTVPQGSYDIDISAYGGPAPCKEEFRLFMRGKELHMEYRDGARNTPES